MDSEVIFIAPNEETADDEGIEIPLDDDNTCNLKSVQSQFPNAIGLKYRAPETGRMRALRMDEAGKIYPPTNNWCNHTYLIAIDKKRTREEESSNVGSETKKVNSGGSVAIKDLIILGLSYKASEEDVRSYFGSYGDIKSCEIKKDPSGNSRGFGFISFVSDDVSKRVINETYHIISGRKCEVRIPKRTEPERKLFVGRLPRGTTEDDLQEYFSTFGALADVYIPKPPRGFAFVTFEKGDEADAVLKQKHFLRDSPLNVTIPDPPAKKQKFGEGGDHFVERGPVAGPGKFGGFNRENNFYNQNPYHNPQNQQPYGYHQQQYPNQGYQPGYQSAAQSSLPMQVEDSEPVGRQALDESEIEILDAIVKKMKGGRKPQPW